MRKRKDIDYGKDMTPAAIWAAYARETDRLVAACIPASRLHVSLSRADEVAPGQ
jgi:hypothetical protein